MSWKGQISRLTQEIRVLASPTAARSAVAREYWANNYQMVKMMNPRFPFILRDITEEGVDPYVIVKYDFNESKVIELGGLSAAEIDSKLKAAVEAGATMPRSGESDPYVLPPIIE